MLTSAILYPFLRSFLSALQHLIENLVRLAAIGRLHSDHHARLQVYFGEGRGGFVPVVRELGLGCLLAVGCRDHGAVRVRRRRAVQVRCATRERAGCALGVVVGPLVRRQAVAVLQLRGRLGRVRHLLQQPLLLDLVLLEVLVQHRVVLRVLLRPRAWLARRALLRRSWAWGAAGEGRTVAHQE